MSKHGIKRKLIASLVITTLILMSLFFILLDRYLKDYSIKETEKTISVLGRNTSSLLSKPLFYNDYNQLEGIVRSIILEEFDYLVIFDNISNNLAFKIDKGGVTENLVWEAVLKNKKEYERSVLKLKREEFTQFLFLISSPGVNKPLGYLIIGVSQKKINSKLAGITQRIVMVSVMLFLAFTFATYFLSNRIIEPIKQLSYKIGKFASGDYSVRSDINSKDEIGNLSYNFNFMADKINEQILSIESYSKNLEDMVEERTEELLKALDAIKERDDRLNQAEKINSLNSIVSSIAHEINNPLAIISGNLQLLEPRMEDQKQKKKINTAQEAIHRIDTLINEINFFSAVKDVDTSPVSFSTILNEVAARIVPESIALTIDGSGNDEGPMEHVDTNAHLLTVSLENILKNSVELIAYRQKEGKIHIRYYKDTPHFVVEITDNAGGIDEPGRVFDPFYTTFNEKKGLGLTFVYHAVQGLNGDVSVENVVEGDHKGAMVRLMLPIAIEEEDAGLFKQLKD